MKKLLFFSFFVLNLSSAFSQTFELPKNYELQKGSDYTAYEKDFISAIDWLVSTSPDQQREKRKEVSGFAMQWMMGSPDLTISLSTDIATFTDNGDCLMAFMGGWAKYAIETKDASALKGNLAGLETVFTFYEKYKNATGKIPAVEKLLKIKNKGQLEEFVKSKL